MDAPLRLSRPGPGLILNEPCLYILCGLPFTGKTTLARALEQQLGIALVELDDINSVRGVGLRGEAISPEEWDRTYAEAYRQLDTLLAAGQSVLFDAASFTKAQRDFLRILAGKRGASSLVIYLDVSEVEARQRWLQNRATGARYDVRDEDFAQVVNFFEPPTPEEQAVYYRPSQPADEWIQQTFLAGDISATT